ncbi:MAG: cation-translocating P-type ATPase, partial [Nitrospirae bacterium]|nr:cation-translocating P-type ATPase [Nitrospirota bacterium]
YSAGIRVVMMTGDYSVTASAIARQAGLRPADEILTGHDLQIMRDAELNARTVRTNIFARVVPEQKLRLVNAFKSRGEIVAMTGDGVNDAPALKGADIGIAMGNRGTDVAREAAALVLLDDDFSSIVQAIREGRRIFDNLQKAMSYLLAVHIPIVGMSVIPLTLGWPLMFTPIHIVFMEFIIDPACSIVFESEKEEANIMKRPPRSVLDPIFRKKSLFVLFMQGAIVFLIILGLYGYALKLGWDERHARSIAFTALIVSNLAQIFANRSMNLTLKETLMKPNPALWGVVVFTLFFLAVVLYTPSLQRLFQFSPLNPMEMTGAFLAGMGTIIWFELYKVVDLKG